MRRFVLSGALLTAAILPVALRAQTWRSFDFARQQRDTLPLAVHLSFGAGTVKVSPDAERNLYDVHMRYDAERVDPLYRFDSPNRRLEIGTRKVSMGNSVKNHKGSELNVDLSRASALNLNFEVGAADAEFDLSGLRVEHLALKTGASDTRLRFDAPNPARMRELRIEFGAANVQATGLGNANAERVDISFGVGRASLDFGGEWRNSVDLSINSALGEAVLRVPTDVGVRVESSTFLASLDAPGLTKKDGVWTSSNWDTATHKLRIRASGALGRLEIARMGREQVERGTK
ncbi:MAG TPA: hypothetical protein VJR92_08340 [Gemmatimonadaceae bacterium]|nr:hypothetical protein [Gemmatimonadaceae bacterium]